MLTYLKKLLENSPTGLINYAEYIEAVLYHPEFGYYMKDKQKIGRQGDFITTSNISDVYGRLVARWFATLCETNRLAPVFCEIGAGTGRFAQAFLQEWDASVQLPLSYKIVETSPYHRKLQSNLIKPHPSVVQVESLDQLEPFEGMIFSNELFDALPVHVIEKENEHLYEVMIGLQDEDLHEVKVPLVNPEIYRFLEASELEMHDKQRIEIPLAMGKMIEAISSLLMKGLVVTADYGYSNQEWLDPRRRKGSLRGYYQHQMIEDVLQHPGEMDITTHIHLDQLIQTGEQENLQMVIQLRQDEFLLKAGILQELENHYDPNPFSEVSKRNRAIRSLIMPSGMSGYFQILIQQKSLNLGEADLFSTK